jgi:hypothetical protein
VPRQDLDAWQIQRCSRPDLELRDENHDLGVEAADPGEPMHRPARLFVLGLLTLPSLGCNLIEPRACTAEFRFGLHVIVRNNQTGAPAGVGAVVTATEGAYSETLDGFPDFLTFRGAGERPGIYSIAVNSPGYQPWTLPFVEVEDGECHVKTETVDARLQPLGN